MNHNEHIDQGIDRLIQEERNIPHNPYLSVRIMAALKGKESSQPFPVGRKWKPVLAMASLLVAVVLGVAAGNLYRSADAGTGSELNNDSQTEHFSFYLQPENEEYDAKQY